MISFKDLIAFLNPAWHAAQHAGMGVVGDLAPTKLAIAIAKTLAGVSDTRILMGGDSTTYGVGAVIGSTSLPALLANRLAVRLPVPVINNLIIPQAPTSPTSDSRITIGSGWSYGGNYGFGSNASWQATSGASGNLGFTYSAWANKIRIYYLRNSGLGGFTPTINSVALTAQSAAGAGGVGVYEATFTRSNSITGSIAQTTVGTLFILGIEFFDTTQKCIYIGNAGVAGATAADWNAGGLWASNPMIAAYAPNHSIAMFGINESAQGVTAAAYNAAMTTLAATLAGYGDVDLMTPFQSDPTIGRDTLQTQYLSQLQQISAANGYRLIDVRATLGSYAAANAASLMWDQSHPNAAGYALSAKGPAKYILAVAG
ncbi:SGNH/GDSL hydrolase family protein [Curvibacter gracilis]|uniref:SGNH/GDSL hydrolase family protein n=1 Tax=Curvibacter gracilis TaxID=230310 RepID=UPI000A073F34|nr:SGNH/GDSL hydrolase family protein [Curvibacter gracilis]